MMSENDMAQYADVLTRQWHLNDVEADDLLATGATLRMCDNSDDTVLIHMEMRAEVLALAGSDMQEWVDGFKQAYGGQHNRPR